MDQSTHPPTQGHAPETTKQSPGKPLLDLAINIILPVMILKQTERFGEQGPLIVLLLALSLPVTYGLWEYFTAGKKNVFSLIGVVNILLTGGFALMKLEGHWFAIKEAAVPLAIGLGVLYSIRTTKPLITFFLLNDQVFDTKRIYDCLDENGNRSKFFDHLKKSTVFLSGSFFLSAILNYVLAIKIFKKIDVNLSETEKASILNSQIAEMTWMGYIVIALPMMIVMVFIFMHVRQGIKKYTGLDLTHLIKAN